MQSPSYLESGEPLTIWYHGTSKENAASILKDGFRTGTYLGEDLADAFGYGGSYIFEVVIPASWHSEAGWQMTITEPLPPSVIVSHYHLRKTVILEDDELREKVFQSNDRA